MNEGRCYLFVEETVGGLQYLVLYRYDDGSCNKVHEFAVGFPSPLAREVDSIYGTIQLVGYPVSGGVSPLLVVEEDARSRWYLLYKLENGYWVVSKQFQMSLASVGDGEANGNIGADTEDK